MHHIASGSMLRVDVHAKTPACPLTRQLQASSLILCIASARMHRFVIRPFLVLYTNNNSIGPHAPHRIGPYMHRLVIRLICFCTNNNNIGPYASVCNPGCGRLTDTSIRMRHGAEMLFSQMEIPTVIDSVQTRSSSTQCHGRHGWLHDV